MPELINVLQPDIRKKIEKEVPTIDGGIVSFYSDFFANEWERISSMKDTTEGGYEFTKSMVADWNFADQDGNKLDISIENIKRLPVKTQLWLANTAVGLLQEGTEEKKELPET